MTLARIPLFLAAAGILIFSLGGSCSDDSIYSEECADLSDRIREKIDLLAVDHQTCETDADCTYAAVVLPCNRDNVVNTIIARADYDVFRGEIIALSEDKCDSGNIDQCNAHCGTEGSLIFPMTGAACGPQGCLAVAAENENGGELPSAELCDPEKFVYLPEDIADSGIPAMEE